MFEEWQQKTTKDTFLELLWNLPEPLDSDASIVSVSSRSDTIKSTTVVRTVKDPTQG